MSQSLFVFSLLHAIERVVHFGAPCTRGIHVTFRHFVTMRARNVTYIPMGKARCNLNANDAVFLPDCEERSDFDGLVCNVFQLMCKIIYYNSSSNEVIWLIIELELKKMT